MTLTREEDAPPVAGLLLAAGGGRRLGGRPKALLEHRGRTLAERAVAELAAGGCGPVHVVAGAGAAEVRRRLAGAACTVVGNPDWADGMGSSLRSGLASLAGTRASAVLVMLVDQPGIGAAAVARVVAAHRAGAGLVAASYAGRRGHPVLFARPHWAGVAASATGDQGARAYLRAHAAAVTAVTCDDVADPDDIDVPADLVRLLG
ncbi:MULTISPECIES: nucleotidyltransferase family protein [Streptomyces]|uniref:nucleotidyltransferase family protein n=1 Tax=Streptomyces TaxID=1883 RepID=UPI00163C870C|nr:MULTISPECIES: NTP transferase domain-containing protein [Streptomyces]MBC2877631.1 NTP transferase domain-containing protein [Streptomyces sp. TYQ1024]UBI36138.1 NTP transferase domain-containing protein [Streptomyces mobaraensis]UKW28733.1 NTP transferase domain-containing protein [Streptomyces sp. TYQ1024]